MSNTDDDPNDSRARRLAAAEWVIRLHNTHADEETMERWLAWCQADPANLHTFDSVRGLWSAMERPALQKELIAQLSGERRPGLRERMDQFKSRITDRLSVGAELLVSHHRGFNRLAVAFSVAALGLGIMHRIEGRTEFTQTFSTAVASLSRQTLPDGSVVELGAKSKVRVQISHKQRAIFVDDGEAFFRVAKDPTRPFVVRVGDISVVALGTEFNVRKARNDVVVTVEEGSVSVAPETSSTLGILSDVIVPQRGSPPKSAIRANAGRRVSYSSSARAMTVTEFRAEAPDSDDWAVGHLHFVNEPLASVITDVNRYSPRPISLADDAIGTLTFTGTLRRDAIDDWLHGVREVFGIEIRDEGEKGIVLSRKN